jgi:hypothetical protein
MKHNNDQMKERILYKSRTIKAIQNPKEYMSVIIDGMNTSYVPLKMPMTKGNFPKKIDATSRCLHSDIF